MLGAEATSLGTKFERTLIGGFLGGPSVRSMAVEGLGGGTPGEAIGGRPEAEAGDAVCARGGGSGAEGAAASAGA